jgi:hypothetical protein
VDVVAAAVVLEGHVQRLMDVADPVAEEFQRFQFFIVICGRHKLF